MQSIRIIEENQNNQQLQKIANYLYKKYFHHTLHCKITFDKTLEYDNLAGETFNSWYYNKPRIFISPYNARNYNNKEALDTIKHELIHYYLFKIKDKNGSGHTKHFYQIASKIGVRCSNHTPWDLNFPACKKEFKNHKNKPVYLYYSYKIGIYWRYYQMPYGSHIYDKYDKKRLVHYLGFLPTYALVPTIKYTKKIIHNSLNLNTPDIINKLRFHINKLQNNKYKKYVTNFFHKELKQNHQQALIKNYKLKLLHTFATAINCENAPKLKIIISKIYKKYFNNNLYCKIILKPNIHLPKFTIKKHHAYICINTISLNSFDNTYGLDDARSAIKRIKLCLLHYYLWSTNDLQGFKYSKKYYQLAKKKFHMVLRPKDKPLHIIQNPRKSFRTLYYSYQIGIWWSSNFIDSEYHYVYFKNYKPKKAYYLSGCNIEEYSEFYNYLNEKLKKYQKLHLNSTSIANHLHEDVKKLDHIIYNY